MPGFKGDVRPLEVQLEEYLRVNLADIDNNLTEVYRRVSDLEAKRKILRDMQCRFIDLKKEPTNG